MPANGREPMETEDAAKATGTHNSRMIKPEMDNLFFIALSTYCAGR